MKIGIVYNPPAARGDANWESSVDVLTQVEAIESALQSAGRSTRRIALARDLTTFLDEMREQEIDAVFNLCETIEEDPALCWHPAAVLELLNVPFSGSPSRALVLTADKILAKQLLAANGIRTPGFLEYHGLEDFDPSGLEFPVIVKPRFEDASIGIEQESIFETASALTNKIETFKARFGPIMVEEYVEGREFNVSLIGYPEARVLPMAEIDFSAFPENLYRIVGYRAKWIQDSFEYNNTPRLFSAPVSSGTSSELRSTALACFNLFGLRDYGRVDMRVDGQGRVYVLEVNANPCISPDAGLAASYEREGSTYEQMANELCNYLIKRMPRSTSTSIASVAPPSTAARRPACRDFTRGRAT